MGAWRYEIFAILLRSLVEHNLSQVDHGKKCAPFLNSLRVCFIDIITRTIWNCFTCIRLWYLIYW